MMLADGEQFDVAYEDHFVGVHLETGFQNFLWPVSEAGEQLLARAPDTVRRVQQTFTVGSSPMDFKNRRTAWRTPSSS